MSCMFFHFILLALTTFISVSQEREVVITRVVDVDARDRYINGLRYRGLMLTRRDFRGGWRLCRRFSPDNPFWNNGDSSCSSSSSSSDCNCGGQCRQCRRRRPRRQRQQCQPTRDCCDECRGGGRGGCGGGRGGRGRGRRVLPVVLVPRNFWNRRETLCERRYCVLVYGERTSMKLKVVGFEDEESFNLTMPIGTFRHLFCSSGDSPVVAVWRFVEC